MGWVDAQRHGVSRARKGMRDTCRYDSDVSWVQGSTAKAVVDDTGGVAIYVDLMFAIDVKLGAAMHSRRKQFHITNRPRAYVFE